MLRIQRRLPRVADVAMKRAHARSRVRAASFQPAPFGGSGVPPGSSIPPPASAHMGGAEPAFEPAPLPPFSGGGPGGAGGAGQGPYGPGGGPNFRGETPAQRAARLRRLRRLIIAAAGGAAVASIVYFFKQARSVVDASVQNALAWEKPPAASLCAAHAPVTEPTEANDFTRTFALSYEGKIINVCIMGDDRASRSKGPAVLINASSIAAARPLGVELRRSIGCTVIMFTHAGLVCTYDDGQAAVGMVQLVPSPNDVPLTSDVSGWQSSESQNEIQAALQQRREGRMPVVMAPGPVFDEAKTYTSAMQLLDDMMLEEHRQILTAASIANDASPLRESFKLPPPPIGVSPTSEWESRELVAVLAAAAVDSAVLVSTYYNWLATLKVALRNASVCAGLVLIDPLFPTFTPLAGAPLPSEVKPDAPPAALFAAGAARSASGVAGATGGIPGTGAQEVAAAAAMTKALATLPLPMTETSVPALPVLPLRYASMENQFSSEPVLGQTASVTDAIVESMGSQTAPVSGASLMDAVYLRAAVVGSGLDPLGTVPAHRLVSDHSVAGAGDHDAIVQEVWERARSVFPKELADQLFGALPSSDRSAHPNLYFRDFGLSLPSASAHSPFMDVSVFAHALSGIAYERMQQVRAAEAKGSEDAHAGRTPSRQRAWFNADAPNGKMSLAESLPRHAGAVFGGFLKHATTAATWRLVLAAHEGRNGIRAPGKPAPTNLFDPALLEEDGPNILQQPTPGNDVFPWLAPVLSVSVNEEAAGGSAGGVGAAAVGTGAHEQGMVFRLDTRMEWVTQQIEAIRSENYVYKLVMDAYGLALPYMRSHTAEGRPSSGSSPTDNSSGSSWFWRRPSAASSGSADASIPAEVPISPKAVRHLAKLIQNTAAHAVGEGVEGVETLLPGKAGVPSLIKVLSSAPPRLRYACAHAGWQARDITSATASTSSADNWGQSIVVSTLCRAVAAHACGVHPLTYGSAALEATTSALMSACTVAPMRTWHAKQLWSGASLEAIASVHDVHPNGAMPLRRLDDVVQAMTCRNRTLEPFRFQLEPQMWSVPLMSLPQYTHLIDSRLPKFEGRHADTSATSALTAAVVEYSRVAELEDAQRSRGADKQDASALAEALSQAGASPSVAALGLAEWVRTNTQAAPFPITAVVTEQPDFRLFDVEWDAPTLSFMYQIAPFAGSITAVPFQLSLPLLSPPSAGVVLARANLQVLQRGLRMLWSSSLPPNSVVPMAPETGMDVAAALTQASAHMRANAALQIKSALSFTPGKPLLSRTVTVGGHTTGKGEIVGGRELPADSVPIATGSHNDIFTVLGDVVAYGPPQPYRAPMGAIVSQIKSIMAKNAAADATSTGRIAL